MIRTADYIVLHDNSLHLDKNPDTGHSGNAWIAARLVRLLLMIVAVAATASAQTTSGQPGTVTGTQPQVGVQPGLQSVFKSCGEVQPDATFLIPETFSERQEASGSGAYGYRARCPYWVVDFLMNRFSHTSKGSAGSVIKNNVLFSGFAFDLPSSKGAGDDSPTVEEDCKRFLMDVIVYRKAPNENKFTKIASTHAQFLSWNSSSKTCSLKGLSNRLSEHAPNANMLKIRIAVRVKLRGSWQEAAGHIIAEPPPVPN